MLQGSLTFDDFARAIWTQRRALNLTRADLSRLSAVSPANIARIEYRAVTTAWATLAALLSALCLRLYATDPRTHQPLPAISLQQLGSLIRGVREHLGLSQRDFAHAARIDRKTLLKVERGDPGCSAARVLHCLLCLKIDLRIAVDREAAAARARPLKRSTYLHRRHPMD